MIYKFYGRPINWERWGFSIAVVSYECPKCGAPKEHYCSSPSGKKVWPPHVNRCKLLTEEEIERTKIKCITGIDLIMEIYQDYKNKDKK